MEPQTTSEGWMVWTSSGEPNRFTSPRSNGWHWASWGPRGTQTGVEPDARSAEDRAMTAAYMMREPEKP